MSEKIQQPEAESQSKVGVAQKKQSQQKSKQSPYKTREGKLGPIQAKQKPIQRKVKQSNGGDQLKGVMSTQYGVDLSGYTEHQNSSFPASIGAAAAIQGKNIHYGPEEYTEQNRKHELGHIIDNTFNGIPKGDKVVNGQSIDTTREKAVDKIANTPLQRQTSLSPLITPQVAPVIQRMKIKGSKKKGKRLIADLKNKAKQWAKDAGLNWEQNVEEHFNQATSSDIVFHNEEAFFKALCYDVNCMTRQDGGEPTAQEAWTTSWGWRARANGEREANPETGDVRLYRTMSRDEYDAINNGESGSLSGHLGDFKQALRYLYGNGGKAAGEKVLVEFIISRTNLNNLYRNATFPEESGGFLPVIAEALQRENKGFLVKRGASGNEGNSKDGSIGLKSESGGEVGHSIAIGSGAKTSQTFLASVSEYNILAYSNNDGVTWEQDPGTIRTSGEITEEEKKDAVLRQQSEPQRSPEGNRARRRNRGGNRTGRRNRGGNRTGRRNRGGRNRK
ncbi:MAG TPA: hypothetical protein DCS93_35670 [Microscillaceae bacterium]|nr:hypothetical protein [Microscillaceae bacterium]